MVNVKLMFSITSNNYLSINDKSPRIWCQLASEVHLFSIDPGRQDNRSWYWNFRASCCKSNTLWRTSRILVQSHHISLWWPFKDWQICNFLIFFKFFYIFCSISGLKHLKPAKSKSTQEEHTCDQLKYWNKISKCYFSCGRSLKVVDKWYQSASFPFLRNSSIPCELIVTESWPSASKLLI